MGFLGELATQINSQFSIGENHDQSLDAVVNGQQQKFSNLGDFAKKIDQSAERRYVEEGFLRRDPYNVDNKQFEILMQEPNATVLVKKRMFSSIGENYRPDFMDSEEKLYIKATKVLFANKCRQIAALEKLSKIQKVTQAVGNISNQLLPIIIGLTDDAGSGFNTDGFSLFGGLNENKEVSNFTKVIDRLRKLYAFNTTNQFTTWITDNTNIFQSQFGQGTGVIEITNFNQFTTTTTTSLSAAGSFSFSVIDPYESMLITEYDIERALSDATNAFYNHKISQFGQQGTEQVINDTQTKLNQLRAKRKVSPISFKINPDTLLYKRVVAIVDRVGAELPFAFNPGFGGIGGNVDVSEDYLKGGAVLGIEGLSTDNEKFGALDLPIVGLVSGPHAGTDSELSLFQQLVSAIFNKIQLEANSRSAFLASNKNTNYARRKMRFNFSGKLIIQPMDIVHIYVNSRSRYDNRLLSGLQNMFTGAGILQNLNKTFTDFKNSFDTLFNPSGSVNLQAEKSAFVGPDFPNFLWSIIRNNFVTEKEGAHVFGGVVENVADSWSDGRFTMQINGRDNTLYFDMGKINFKPSVDVFNGPLLDPLTPFKSRFDTITSAAKSETPDLLDENKVLLGSSQDLSSPLVKFKLGPNAGQQAHTDNIIQDAGVDKTTGQIRKIFYAPDGLVYKWKEGIGTLTQFGSSIDLNDPDRIGNPTIFNEPFAGQDVMNVLSLLITGQPYNFANYWRVAQNLDGFGRDPQSQQDAAYSYYTSLRNDLIKNNVVWGNFIPFKNLVMDEQSFAQAMAANFRVVQKNQDLDAKVKKLLDLKTKTALFAAGKVLTSGDDSTRFDQDNIKAQAQVDELSKIVQDTIGNIQKSDQSLGNKFNADTSFDFSEFIDNSKISKQASDPNLRRLLRRQLNYLTRRMSYNVRANEDKNLFIVDDYYDKDYDILAYEQSLTDGIKLFNNEFMSVKEKIDATAQLLNLEVFCDTQGHIRVRPPQYNRMPSSVFYRMMFLKKANGVQVFPQFLDDLFHDQIDGLKKRIEILEDEIRLDCAVLGINDDFDARQFIAGGTALDNTGDTFDFISSEDSGEITDIQGLMKEANPDQREDSTSATFTTIEKQVQSTKDTFNNSRRFQAIIQSLTQSKLDQSGYGIQDVPAFNTNARIDDLIQRIQTKSGQRIPRTSFLFTTGLLTNGVVIPEGQAIDVFKTTQELSDKIRERQKLLKLFFNAIKNAVEFKSLDDDDDNTGNQLLTPGNFGNSNTPEVFEHMIEDESYDDYGIGSGSRYVIKRAQIRSMNFSETPPDFTYVEVHGQLDPFLSNTQLPGALNSFERGGNGLVTAAAVDYDTWRNYGFRQQAVMNVPFLSDPETQCAPYASMILSRARRNILRGTVTISGNEFMQPGEVVFIEDRGMLFYVSSVTHSFTYASGFTTTLNLTYGHTPGEYIPTTLDVIGKLLYNNRDHGNIVIQRQSGSSNDSNIGVVQMDGKNQGAIVVLDSGNKDDPTNAYSIANSQTINNILYTAAYTINANNTRGNTIKASVELRLYHNDSNPESGSLKSFAETVQGMLTGSIGGPKNPASNSTGVPNPHLNADDVVIVSINMSDDTEKRSPSQKALDAARNQIANSGLNSGDGSSSLDKNKLTTSLFNFVIDCWLRFEQVPIAQAKTNGTVPPS